MTTNINIKRCHDINFIDSPGFGDPNKNRSDNKILSEIVDKVLGNAANFGLSSILQCVMVPISGRISSSAF